MKHRKGQPRPQALVSQEEIPLLCSATSPWDHPDVVDFYSSARRGFDDFYPSEQRLAPYVARRVRGGRLLDVGCAVGGFSDAWLEMNPLLEYVGVDVGAALVQKARTMRPHLQFIQADAAEGLPMPDRYADTVVALGWLHLDLRWRAALDELRRVTRRRLLFDVRIAFEQEGAMEGQQRIELQGAWDGHSVTPYHAVSWLEFAELVATFRPRCIFGVGYEGRPAPSVRGILGRICFGAFIVEFDDVANDTPIVALDMPLIWPNTLAADIRSVEWLDDTLSLPGAESLAGETS